MNKKPTILAVAALGSLALIGTGFAILRTQLDRVARIPEVHKIDTFDGFPLLDVQTGDDSLCKHIFLFLLIT